MTDTPLQDMAPADPEPANAETPATPEPTAAAGLNELAERVAALANNSTANEPATADLEALNALAQEAIEHRARTKSQVDEMMATITGLRSQLRSEAVTGSATAAGAVDAEVIAALIPADAETPDQVRDAIASLKERKPHLFGTPGKTAPGVMVTTPEQPPSDDLGTHLVKLLGL